MSLQDKNKEFYENLIHKNAGNWYKKIYISEYSFREDLKNRISYVSCDVQIAKQKNLIKIENKEGKGLVDGLFSGILEKIEKDYPSLKGIKFVSFGVEANINKKNKKSNQADAEVTTKIVIENSRSFQREFKASSFSMTASSIETIRKAIEFFVNAEIAVIKLYAAIKDAKKRYREDLVSKYTEDLSELVKITSYETTIKKLK